LAIDSAPVVDIDAQKHCMVYIYARRAGCVKSEVRRFRPRMNADERG
jgi:hypothetical protein